MALIVEHHVLQFTKNVELLLQQKQSRLMGKTGTGSYTGDAAQVVLQFGALEMADNTNWTGDTPITNADHQQRWVLPSDKELGLMVTKEDQIRMIVDPKSPYADIVRAAYNRAYDKALVAAAFADAKTGPYNGMVNTPFPNTQMIGGATATDGLTVDKLNQAREMLDAAEVEDFDTRYIVCTAQQVSNLLNDQKVTSADYNTVKALVNGEVNQYLGFEFIRYEALPLATKTRSCIAYAKSGLHIGTWNGLEVHMDQRPDKKYCWQIYAKATIGATRTQEKKVIKINCLER